MSLFSKSLQIMQKIRFTLILSVFALVSVAQAADEVRYYDIETIIFESLDPSARQSENWKTDIDRQIPPVVAELDQPYPGQFPPQYDPNLTFKTLPKNTYQLQDAEKLLANSRQYRILLHTAWVQPGMGPDVALPVHINLSFITDTPVTHSLIPSTSETPPSNPALPTGTIQTRSVLDGYIKIILTRYLHADVDLVYTTGLPLTPQNETTSPAAPADETTSPITQAPPVIYRLSESRRMRSKELHYLDHPVLGMLLLITQYEGKTPTPLGEKR